MSSLAPDVAWLADDVPRRRAGPAEAGTLRGWQLDRAWAVAERLARDNPFYAPRLGALPVDRTEATFRTLPITTKSEVVDDCVSHPPYGRRTTCAPEQIRQVVETSGTSGRGREVYALDERDERAIYDAEAIGFWWAGVRPGARVLLTLPVGMSAAGLWYLGGLRMIGANVMSVGAYDTDRKVAVLRRYGAEVVVGTPSYVQKLAAACEEQGVDPTSLGVRSLLVAGESYSLEWAREIQRRWGATLYEQYGCTERVVAWTCPGGVVAGDSLGVLHFPPELAFVELVDPGSGEPPDSGDAGEILTTPLWASASPLLRFATRDRAEYVAPGECRCGRPLPGIRAGAVHRYDDMLKIKGVNVWPAHFDSAVFEVAGVSEYRGVVGRRADGAEYVEVTIECPADVADELRPKVGRSIRRVAGIGAEVLAVAPGEISRSVPEGFVKVVRWRDLRERNGRT